MGRILSISMLLVLSIYTAKAQQEAHYTQFMYSNMLNNAGFTGSRGVTTLTALYRNQWMGFEGSPRSYMVSLDMPFKSKRLGTGVVLYNQTEGIINRTVGNFSSSYDIINTKDKSLRLGLNIGLRQYRFDFENPDLFVMERRDPSINYDKPSLTNMNVGAGLYFDSKNFYFGLSSPNLNKNVITLRSDSITQQFSGIERRHFYTMGGGLIPLGSKLMLKPAFMFKYVQDAPWSVDANVSLMYNKRISGGVALRFGAASGSAKGESVDFLGFFQATDNLGIGVAYDVSLTQLRNYSSGSMEAILRYDFGVDTRKLHNPRIFF
jgi:type IX secretion system PorP/SprF family membrane protein